MNMNRGTPESCRRAIHVTLAIVRSAQQCHCQCYLYAHQSVTSSKLQTIIWDLKISQQLCMQIMQCSFSSSIEVNCIFLPQKMEFQRMPTASWAAELCLATMKAENLNSGRSNINSNEYPILLSNYRPSRDFLSFPPKKYKIDTASQINHLASFLQNTGRWG